jgi:hypothetical protein
MQLNRIAIQKIHFMRTVLILGVLCCTLAMTACARQKKTAASKTAQSANTTAAAQASSISAMYMRRGGCFGQCPIYEVYISSDGNARYVGQQFVENPGTFEKNIGPEKAAELFRMFDRHRVDTCKGEYEVLIPDLAPLTYTFTRSTGTQRINSAHFGPYFLQLLADSVDAVVQVDKSWKKTAEPPKD